MKSIKQTAIWGAMLVLCISVAVYQIFFSLMQEQQQKSEKPQYAYEEVSTNPSTGVVGWGIKRNSGGKTPDADPGAPALLKKYGALYVGDTTKKTIYLTFDEGYENGYTAKILDVLKENDVKAIFFITGDYLEREEALIRRMVEEGHEVGNHTYNHPSLPTCDKATMEEELTSLDKDFSQKFGTTMRFLRPPKGEYNENSLAITQKLGYINLFWSFAYADWDVNNQKGTDYACKMVMDNLHNGAVLLLHAVSKDNANALDAMIKGAQAAGYTFGTPEELAVYAKEMNEK